MNLIKNAIIFQADLPDIDAMVHHLSQIPFEPVGKTFVSRSGFVANGITAELVTPIEGGYSFSVRLDHKILPGSSVRMAVNEAVQAYADEHEIEVSEVDEATAGAIAEQTTALLIEHALVKTATLNCFYSEIHKFLIIPTTVKDLAQTVVGLLIKAIGSVKTSTIHVDNIKGGLTTRLKKHLGLEGEELAEDAFDGFKLGAICNMAYKSDKVSFNLGDLDAAKQGLLECLGRDMTVDIMELVHENVGFKLTHDFKLKGLKFFGELTDAELEQREDADEAFMWRIEAATQLLQVCALVIALCELFSYERPELVEATIPAAETDAVPLLDGEKDGLYDEAVAFVRESRRASISAVQRKLKIGYNRAARLIEMMEAAGVVTAMNSNGSREVLF